MLVGKIKKRVIVGYIYFLVFKISRVVLLLVTMVTSISIHCLADLRLFVSRVRWVLGLALVPPFA